MHDRRSKLTDDMVLEIRRAYIDDERLQKSLAKEHGISVASVNAVLGGKRWGHVTHGVDVRRLQKPSSASAEVMEIFRRGMGYDPKEMAEEYELHVCTIRNLKRKVAKEQWGE